MHSEIVSSRIPFRDREWGSGRSAAEAESGLVETEALWRVLRHHQKLTFVIAALATVAALIYGIVSPSPYAATAQIIIDPRDKLVVTNDINPNAMSPDGGIAQVESQVSVVQSNAVLLRAVKATNLVEDPEFNRTGLVNRILRLFEGKTAGSSAIDPQREAQERALGALRKQLTVKRADKVFVIDVTVKSQSRDKAARLANAVADAYLADQAQARSEAALRASQELTSRLADLRARVQAAEEAVTNYRTTHNLVVSSGQRVSDQQLNELTSQLSSAQSRTAALKAQLDQQAHGSAVADGSSEALNSAVVTKLRERESAAVENLASLEVQLGPRHPSYIAAKSELAHLRALIRIELTRLHRATQGDYDRARADERARAKKLEQLKSQSLETDKADVRLQELKDDLEAVRSVYNNFLHRAKETSEQASVNSANARIITRALRPDQRSFPPLGLLVFGGALTGLGLGVAAGLLREYSAPLVMSAGQISAIAEAPVFGALPAGSEERPETAGGDDMHASKAPDRSGLDPISNRVIQLLLRDVSCAQTNRGRHAGRCLVVTSTLDDEAQRRRVAKLIADVAARNGDDVLLVDADVANGKEGRLRGFLDLLRGDCPPEDVLRVLRGRDYALIGKGRQGESTGRGGQRNAAAASITRLRRNFDLTVVDAGAPTENYLAAPVLGEADEVLMISEMASTRQKDAAAEAAAIKLIGVSVTGVLLVDKAIRA
jgi:uncharacterized protein involved in exopolysaccharide biosynthesis